VSSGLPLTLPLPPQVGACLVLHLLALARRQEGGQQPLSLEVSSEVQDHFQVRTPAGCHWGRRHGRQGCTAAGRPLQGPAADRLPTMCCINPPPPHTPTLQAAADSIQRWRGKQLHDWRAGAGSKDWQRLRRELERFFATSCVLHRSGERLGLTLAHFGALLKLCRVADEAFPLQVTARLGTGGLRGVG
jgi:hypothetical protein